MRTAMYPLYLRKRNPHARHAKRMARRRMHIGVDFASVPKPIAWWKRWLERIKAFFNERGSIRRSRALHAMP